MTGGLVDVLVVGAGPTGLALAAELAAFGVRARLIDRGLDRVHESRALAIQPRTLEVLAGLGVTGELIASGSRAVQLRMHVPGRVLTVPMFDLGLDDSAYPFLLFLSQAETERVLGEHLAAAGVPVDGGALLRALLASARDRGRRGGTRAGLLSWPRRGVGCFFPPWAAGPGGGCRPGRPPPIARHPMHRSSSTRCRPSPAPTPAAPCG